MYSGGELIQKADWNLMQHGSQIWLPRWKTLVEKDDKVPKKITVTSVSELKLFSGCNYKQNKTKTHADTNQNTWKQKKMKEEKSILQWLMLSENPSVAGHQSHKKGLKSASKENHDGIM